MLGFVARRLFYLVPVLVAVSLLTFLIASLLPGDFGRSFRTGQTVLQAVSERLPVSVELMLMAEIIGVAIGVPLAIACAVRSGSAFDRFMTGSAFGMLSVPTFLSAILLIYLFAVEFRWLPATGYIPFEEDPVGNLRSVSYTH